MTAMTLYPAIDLLSGRCVRLHQGDYDRETVYGDDPAAQAVAFAAAGAEAIHVVDLDAARTGQPTNRGAIAEICSAVTVPVQVGGGVRSVAAAESLFAAGVHRVVIGTAALENPGLVADVVARGGRVAVGIDARGDEVATHGWTERSGHTVGELAERFADVGVDALVVTEISRDGTQQGPDETGLRALLTESAVPIIASGGVGTLDHLRSLARVEHVDETGTTRRLSGVIVGRALYERSFTVADGLAAVAWPTGSEV